MFISDGSFGRLLRSHDYYHDRLQRPYLMISISVSDFIQTYESVFYNSRAAFRRLQLQPVIPEDKRQRELSRYYQLRESFPVFRYGKPSRTRTVPSISFTLLCGLTAATA